MPIRMVVLVISAFAGLGTVGCARCDAPAPPAPAMAPPPEPPAPAPVRDAGPDAMDARSDAADGPAATPVRHAVKKPAAAPADGGGGGFKVDGSLSKADAEKIVHGGLGKLRACSPDAKGRVTFRLTVDARGRVTLGEVVTSTLSADDAEMCLIRATRDFKFPAGAGESIVTFSMNFGR